MRHELCTLFDANYLPRALALYRSLEEHSADFRLRVYCMDERAAVLLERLDLANVSLVALAELERHDPALLDVKPGRTQVEYCWTATPAICLHALETEPGLEGITYLDADLMFFADPRPLFEELGNDSVLIVPHRYTPERRGRERTKGIYNVEWLTFRRDERGLAALRWWHDRCIEWCYHRYEDGKMGDQKYLDDWPQRFEGVHVLRHLGGGLAPWNIDNYELSVRGGGVHVDDDPLVFFHYHSLRLYEGPRPLARLTPRFHVTGPLVWKHDYPIDETKRRLIWNPYLRRLADALRELRELDPGFRGGLRPLGRAVTRDLAAGARRRLRGARGRVASKLAVGRYRDTWKGADISQQMLALASEQLRDPVSVPPYRTFLEIAAALAAEPDLPHPARIIDLGCGVGHYSELLERHFPGRFAYTGVDFSPAMVERARAAFPAREFLVGDLFDGTLDLDAYDIVLASALVDVLPDYERALDILLGCDAPYVVLHRQRMTEGRSRAELAPGYEGQRTHRTYLNRGRLEEIARGKGRTVAMTFGVDGNVKSFVLAKTAVAQAGARTNSPSA